MEPTSSPARRPRRFHKPTTRVIRKEDTTSLTTQSSYTAGRQPLGNRNNTRYQGGPAKNQSQANSPKTHHQHGSSQTRVHRSSSSSLPTSPHKTFRPSTTSHRNTSFHKNKPTSSNQTRRTNESRRRNETRTVTDSTKRTPKKTDVFATIPPVADGDIRVVPLCGVEWIGTNMTFIEYKGQIIVIDAGIGFSNPSTPGIDYTIPNTDYLERNKDRIKALIITHGHLDHVGAIPFIIERIGFPPIYTREFGGIFIQKKMEEFPSIKEKVIINTVSKDEGYVTLSEDFQVKFFGLTHSIPDSTGVIIKTPLGGIFFTGDVRVENVDGVPSDEEFKQYEAFKDENILLATIDSTGIEKPGWALSEEQVIENIDNIIKNTNDGRLFIAAFGSQVERLMRFMESAKKYGKYVAIDGRSMKSNMAIAETLGLTDFSHVIPIENIHEYPKNKLLIIVTGSQGEEYSGLNRIAKGTHRFVKLERTDTIVLSSSVVPGNEYEVAQLKNRLYRGSFNVVTYLDTKVHASGHGAREELKWIHTRIPYKFFMPIHGEPYMIRMHAKMAQIELGVPIERIAIPDNGSIIEIRNNGNDLIVMDEKIPAEPHIVEGNNISEKQEVLFRDRKTLADDGILIIVLAVEARTGKLKKSPDIISRGFIYLRENQELLQSVRSKAKRLVEQAFTKGPEVNLDHVKEKLASTISKHLTQETQKNPIVIPVILTF